MRSKFTLAAILYAIIFGFLANSFLLIRQCPWILLALVPLFLFGNFFAGLRVTRLHNKRFLICQHGTVLLSAFYISIFLSAAVQILLAFLLLPHDWKPYLWNVLLCIGVYFVVFWNGILCVYLTSTQLGIKVRVIGLLCGMIPIANLVALFFIIRTTTNECLFEYQKEQLSAQRKDDQLCATRYPILLVHGIFFRDTTFFNYWGRIPQELERNGAVIYYGNHPSASSVADSARYLKWRILALMEETGAEKLNIIAHSKGGLDCRYAIANLGIGEHIASLTTINTPHRGCLFAEYLLTKIPQKVQLTAAKTYNNTLAKFGERDADFLAAVKDLTESRCRELNEEMPTPEGIYCQSVGSVMKKASSGKFPLNFSHHLVKHFSGENDGLVSTDSFQWGENYTLLRPSRKRGISHGDMIDLNRENIRGFDVREFYVNLVSDLKNKGY
jgi:triacylglycerol lipase